MNEFVEAIGELKAEVRNLHEAYRDGKKAAINAARENSSAHYRMMELLSKKPDRKEMWKTVIIAVLLFSTLGSQGMAAIKWLF